MMLYVLWMITSSYAVPLGTFPTAGMCAQMAVEIKTPPRAVLADVVCMPSLVLPGIAPRPPVQMRPERPSVES